MKLILCFLLMGSFYTNYAVLAKPTTETTKIPDEEEYNNTPFTQYGEFNQSDDEAAETKFFQFGRFFGVSLGLGFEFVDNNRGNLWQGGFPLIDFKLHYWFDFNVALDLGFTTVSQYYYTLIQNLGYVNVTLFQVGLDFKYYFDVKELSAAVSFANPYILLGAGSYSKTESSFSAQTQDYDTSLGVRAGGGLEFTLNPKKLYFAIEGKIHIITFKDTNTTMFQSIGLSNLQGNFYTAVGNLLFTW